MLTMSNHIWRHTIGYSVIGELISMAIVHCSFLYMGNYSVDLEMC